MRIWSSLKSLSGAGIFLIVASGYAAATPNLDPCSGGDCTLVGIFAGNDKSPGPDKSLTVDSAAGADLTLVKVGSNNSADKDDLPGTIGTFTFTMHTDKKSGTWSTTGDAIAYVSVKASNSFALYKYTPAALSGLWSTNGIVTNGGRQPKLSHLTFWTVDGGNEVPEPLSLTLIGAGLTVLGLTRRQRKNKK